MAPITWTDVVSRISTLGAVDLLQQTDLLAEANEFFNSSMLGGEDSARLKSARIYYVGHMASLPGAGSTSPAGPLTVQVRGKLRQEFQGLPQSSSSTWMLTQWGRRLYELIHTSRARWPSVA